MKDSKVMLCVAGFFLMVLVSLIVYPTWVMGVAWFIGEYQLFIPHAFLVVLIGFFIVMAFLYHKKNNSEIA